MTAVHRQVGLAGVLEKLRTLGGTLSAGGERLTLEFPEQVEREVEPLLAELREHKAEVMALLTADKCRVRDREPGLERMRQAWRQVSDLWDEIEASGGSIAWEWIVRGSAHSDRIRLAEDQMNAIGSRGDPAALRAACEAYVSAWRDGIEGWKRAKGMTRAEQRSLDLGQ